MKIRSFLGIILVTLLTACAHPDLIKLEDRYSDFVQQLGKPDSEIVLQDGSRRLVYSQQPMGQQVYELIFDKYGKLIFKDNILQEKYFDRIKPKIQTSEDILLMFGKPCEKWTYKNLGEHTFMYRYQDIAGFPMALWVDFDLERDEVLRYVLSIDPWSQRDSDWEF